ncbi:putative pentatricopeptide repeat-containing protein [Planoprotostelium fungivorum]|uniref:Putative pentatricopeptide repeat-containing protein n=1 Tax=Planoprotostelium fungivorum TaxID=1890364 RepID=A0A2P6NLF1_9EUKA|nr:putative pentatricopeptide repeat-containing protein [Planoprotostelium fungivorum]
MATAAVIDPFPNMRRENPTAIPPEPKDSLETWWEDVKAKKRVTTATFNSILTMHSKRDNIDRMQQIYAEMPSHQVQPDSGTFNIMMGTMLRLGMHQEGEGLFSEMKRRKISPNMITFCHLLQYAKDTRRVDDYWEQMIVMPDITLNPMLFTAALEAYARLGEGASAEQLWREMEQEGIRPTLPALKAVLRALRASGDARRQIEILRETVDSGIAVDVDTYNIVMETGAERHLTNEVARLYQDLVKSNLQPDVRTFNCLLNMYADRAQSSDLEALWREMKKKGVKGDIASFHVAVDNAVKKFDATRMEQLRMDMRTLQIKMDRHVYSRYIEFYCSKGERKMALDTYNDMIAQKVQPGADTYGRLTGLLMSWKDQALIDELHGVMTKEGLTFDGSYYHAAIETSMDRAREEDMMTTWLKAKESGVILPIELYNCLYGYFSATRKYQHAKTVWDHLRASKTKPDMKTFKLVLKYCKVEEITDRWRNMKSSGLEPDQQAYELIVKRLRDNKRDKEAETYAEEGKRFLAPRLQS